MLLLFWALGNPLALFEPTGLRASCTLLDALALVVTAIGVALLDVSQAEDASSTPLANATQPATADGDATFGRDYALAAFVLAQGVRFAMRLLERFRGVAVSARQLLWEAHDEDDADSEQRRLIGYDRPALGCADCTSRLGSDGPGSSGFGNVCSKNCMRPWNRRLSK